MAKNQYKTFIIITIFSMFLISCIGNSGREILIEYSDMVNKAVAKVNSYNKKLQQAKTNNDSLKILQIEKTIDSIKQKTVRILNKQFESRKDHLEIPFRQKSGLDLFIVTSVHVLDALWEDKEPELRIRADFIAKKSIRTIAINLVFLNIEKVAFTTEKFAFSAPARKVKGRLLPKRTISVGETGFLLGTPYFSDVFQVSKVIIR